MEATWRRHGGRAAHLHLLPHVRASWTLRGARPQIPIPGKNRQVTVFGAIEVTTGIWVSTAGPPPRGRLHRPARHARPGVPCAPVIAVICDNDIIRRARKVTAYLEQHPAWGLLYGAR